MDKERKLKALKRSLGRYALLKGNEAVFFCPKCDHRKPKLSVNIESDRFHCWVCEFSGKSLVKLLKLGERREDLEEYIASLKRESSKGESPKGYSIPILPDEFRPLSEPSRSFYFNGAMAYLSQRGVGSEDIRRWKLGYCESGKYKNRIIVPSFDSSGELNFFVGRSFYDHPIKYLHEDLSKDIVFNDYLVDWSKPVIITEGPFDAIKARENAIALQGSSLREDSKLFEKIAKFDVGVYFAMDKDAFKKQLKILEMFFAYGIESFYVDLMGAKDVGEMTHERFLECKGNAKKISSDLDLLRMRVLA